MTAILGNNPKRQTVQYDELKMATQSAMSRENSVLSKIFTTKLNSKESLITLLDSDPLRFIDILLSEISGWTKGSINQNIVITDPIISERFENINLILVELSQHIKENEWKTQSELEDLYKLILNVIEGIEEAERIPENPEKTIFQLQYELRVFTTRFFTENVFVLFNDILSKPNNLLHIKRFIDIYEVIMRNSYDLSIGFFSNPNIEIELCNLEISDAVLEYVRHTANIMRTDFFSILKKYYPLLPDIDLHEYIPGLLAELNSDYNTMRHPFDRDKYTIENNRVKFTLVKGLFQGHSHTNEKEYDDKIKLPANESAITQTGYKVHNLRPHKDCHGYSAVMQFLRHLESVLRINVDPESGKVTQISVVNPAD